MLIRMVMALAGRITAPALSQKQTELPIK